MTGQPLRVALIVEDEWLVRMEIAEALGSAGWSVLEAPTGDHAFQLLEQGTAIDLLVTDIRFGGALNGWDLAEQFRERRPNLAVIYASANPSDEHREVPGSVVVGKPALMSEIVSQAERLWALPGA